MKYNYAHFGPAYYDFTKFSGPRPGERAPDFTAHTASGTAVKLSDFKGKWVVLETGSITCPITDSKVSRVDELQRAFPDAVFILLYTREAHPGEHYGAHASFEEKCERAKAFVRRYGVERMVLVDDLEGTAHRQYGNMPNSVHVINPGGIVVMRGDWNDVRTVHKILTERDAGKLYERDAYSGKPLFFAQKKHGLFKTLKSAGWTAVRDFAVAFPALATMHLKKMLRGKRIES